MSEQRFYRDGRKVLDCEKSSHGTVYCEARSGHAAEVIQHSLNSWAGMGASKPARLAAADFQSERRLKRKYRPKLEMWDELVEALDYHLTHIGYQRGDVERFRALLNRAKQVEGSSK